MKLLNESELEKWIYQIVESNHCIKRFKQFPTTLIDFDWENELERLARIFIEKDPYDITFHNVRMLFKNLKNTHQFNQPLVGLYANKNINIHPGGSRIMVAKYLNLPVIPLDLIIEKNNNEYNNYEFELIDSKDKFLEPFKHIDSEVTFLLNNDQSFNATFSYQPMYHNQFHWKDCEPIQSFISRTKGIKCETLMEYYFL